jgi:DNA polymerase
MDDGPTTWVPRPRIPEVFAKIPWDELAVLAHHAHFDLAILHWIYGYKPRFILDTLSMARALFPTELHSLENLCKILKLPPKGEEVKKFKGYRYADFTEGELITYGMYSMNDTQVTKGAFNKMKSRFPADELILQDHTIRLFTEPRVLFDKPIITQAYEEEKERLLHLFCQAFPKLETEARKAVLEEDHEAWKKLKTPLSSNQQFAQILLDLGIDPPKKLSPTAVKKGTADPSIDFDAPMGLLPKGEKKWTYAFAATDEDFTLLQEHPDLNIASIVEARIGVKSTIRTTRAKRYLEMADRGFVPIYSKYYGAGTGRFSSGDKTNFGNLTKFCSYCNGADDGCPKCDWTGVSSLRRGIKAPPGYVIVVRDLNAIEARVNAWNAGQADVIQMFRQRKQVYCEMASIIFGREITEDDKKQRFIGKTVVLGAGYGMGWKKFAMMLWVGMLGVKNTLLGQEIADALGVSGDSLMEKEAEWLYNTCSPRLTIEQWALHCACAARIITLYRSNNSSIVGFWKLCGQILDVIYQKQYATFGMNDCLRATPEGILLPNDMLIHYTGLKLHMNGRWKEYTILKDKQTFRRSKVYGGLVDENGTQALSRIHLTNCILTMIREGIDVFHHVYDEALALARIDEAQDVYNRMGEILETPPSWGKGLPLASKGGWDEHYIK